MQTNDDETPSRFSARREILVIALGVFVAVAILPPVVYFTGTTLLGAYGTGGLPRFYANLWVDLAHGTPNSWLLVLLPYVALRILWLLLARPRTPSRDMRRPQQTARAERRRREPTLS